MAAHQTRPLLLELLTEELPPKALNTLGQAFAQHLRDTLAQVQLLDDGCTLQAFATPRRLAVHLSAVRGQAPQQAYCEKLMPAQVGLDANGQATAALTKKLAARGWQHLRVQDLIQEADGKDGRVYLYAKGTADGVALAAGVQQALDAAIAALPIPKVMQYQLADGVTTVKFVRPVHRLLALWGADVVPVQALGLRAGRTTEGHRFLCKAPIVLAHADEYEARLHDEGRVIVSFSDRRANIVAQLHECAQSHRHQPASIGNGPEVEALLDEVTALVEWPVVYAGEFDPKFLTVPPECLILTMRLNQKYFPLFIPGGVPSAGQLTHRFLVVSNMQVDNPQNIIEGNQRVMHPRLADAQFFFENDRKQPLAARIPALAHAVYHNRLGSQLQRSQRIEKIACWIAQRLSVSPMLAADEALVARAAQLLKADLTTDMVAEFPELQGIMGAYYAEYDGEDAQVVRALRDQYRLRLGPALDIHALVAAIVFTAERAETLIGIWGIGLIPTGDRDPYALRRAALGLISALELFVPVGRPLPLDALLQTAATTFEPGVLAKDTEAAVQRFVLERHRNLLYAEHERTTVDAVMALAPPLHKVRARILACSTFLSLPEAESLIAANKRIGNLLKKSDVIADTIDAALFTDPAEHALAQTIEAIVPVVHAYLEQGNHSASLTALAGIRQAVDEFFDRVMVMADDPLVRANRLALLARLHGLMNQVADISRLVV